MILKVRIIATKAARGVYLIELTDIAISASEIRALVKEGKSIRYLVPSQVEKYIKRRALYNNRRAANGDDFGRDQFLGKSSSPDPFRSR